MNTFKNTFSATSSRMRSNFQTFSPIIFFAALIFGPLIGTIPNLHSDAYTYIRFSCWRPPVYPAFIWLFHLAGGYQMYLVMWAQSFLLFVSIIYITYWLEQKINLSKFVIFLIVSGTIIIDFVSSRILHHIYSEALAFSLFLIVFSLFIEVFQSYNIRKLICLLTSSALLILTRGQFYFMFVLLIFLSLWYFWSKKPIKQAWVVFLLVFITMMATTFTDWTYHYFKHGEFKGSAFVGRMFAIQPLYLARKSDAKYFKNPLEKNTFIQMMNSIDTHHMSRNTAPYPISLIAQDSRISYYFYQAVFEEIDNFWGEIRYPKKLGINSPALQYKIDSNALQIGKVLLKHHLKSNITMYVWKLTYYFSNPWIFFATLVVFIAVVWRILTDRNWRPSTREIFILVSMIFLLLNAIMIALFQSYDPRYFYYSYFLFFCLLGLVADQFLKKSDAGK